MKNKNFPPMVIMGVSGSGKSTVGALLGQRLGIAFIDGDDLHPAANKEKMGAGIPLNDQDRWPWLRIVGQTLESHQRQDMGIIIACSALKRRYRDLLREHVPDVLFLHLHGTIDTLAARMVGRDHEFMPVTLLSSQLEALEPLESDERHMLLDVRRSPAELAEHVVEVLRPEALEPLMPPAGEKALPAP